MYKVHVHIVCNNEFADRRVFIEVMLPAVPRKGETLFLTEEQKADLENQARKDLSIAKDYFPEWFNHRVSELTSESLEHLEFEEAMLVVDVAYYTGEDVIHVELNILE